MSDSAVKINIERLQNDLTELAQIGSNPDGGVSRPSFSPADLEAREWFKDKLCSACLGVHQDGAGNIFGRKEGIGKTVMVGSHLDSVLNGGIFDGPAGVLAGLECLRTILEKQLDIKNPLEVAAFTDEEGNLVGDFLGARAFTGTLLRETLEQGRTQYGPPLSEILKNTEFSIDGILSAHTQRPEIEAFIELHIEQGPVLETEEKSIGLVDRFAGKNYWQCSMLGKAGHAGTTPFELRQDAFLGLADFALKGTQYVATNFYDSRITFGKAQLHPGVFSIIPARADFTLDFRSTSGDTLQKIEENLLKIAGDSAAARGLKFKYRSVDHTDPVVVPDRMLELMQDICRQEGYSNMRLPSGAGHDAQILASVTDTAMIFIPCEDGVSHSPQEKIKWEDLEKGANLMLETIIRLAG